VAERFWELEKISRNRSYPRNIAIGAVLALLLVALGAITLVDSYSKIRAEQYRESQVLAPASQHLADVFRYYIDQETAMRGYVMTSDRKFLEPYSAAQVRLPYHVSMLWSLIREIPDGDSLLNDIEREHRIWVVEIADREINFTNNGEADRALAITASGAGREQFDRIRAAVAKLEGHLADQREISVARLSSFESRLAWLLLVTLLSLVALIALTTWLLRHHVVKPLTAEIEEQAGLIELSQDAIVTRDVEGPITFWSRGAEALYGYTKDEAIGRVMRELLNTKLPEPKAVMQERFFRDGFWTGLLTHTTKSGQEVMVASRWVLRRDEHGKPSSIFEVNTNVSDRALTALRSATEAQFRQSSPIVHTAGQLRPEAQELRDALRDHRIPTHYQPIVRLGDHQIVGLEALMRWNHPSRGILTPDGFVSEALQNNLMDAMSQMVLERAFEDLAAWSDQDLFVSINLESRQLLSSGLPKRLASMIDRAGIDPKRIWLEIPESLYAEHFSGAIQVVSELRDVGCTIALDDFGAGTSSLDWLARVPVDVLKVDRRFVKGIGRSASDHAVLRAVASLSQEFGLVLVSEGIETVEQRDVLWEMGYDFGQGFLFSRAVEQDALMEALLPAAVLREDLFHREHR
jgi:PAS domain S-box-containing protein